MLRRAPCEVRIPDVPATLGPLECGLSTDSILHYLFVFDQKLLKKIEIIRTFLTFFAVFQFFWSKTGSCLPIYCENKIKKSGMEPVVLFCTWNRTRLHPGRMKTTYRAPKTAFIGEKTTYEGQLNRFIGGLDYLARANKTKPRTRRLRVANRLVSLESSKTYFVLPYRNKPLFLLHLIVSHGASGCQ